MSTPALIDVEALLAPIPGDDPAGKAVPFATREIFDKARKEINPDAFDRMIPSVPRISCERIGVSSSRKRKRFSPRPPKTC